MGQIFFGGQIAQKQAATSGNKATFNYPLKPMNQKGGQFGDHFDREVLNTTAGTQMYAVSSASSGNNPVITNANRVDLDSGTSDGGRSHLAVDQITFLRDVGGDLLRSKRQNMTLDLIFEFTTLNATEPDFFIGLFAKPDGDLPTNEDLDNDGFAGLYNPAGSATFQFGMQINNGIAFESADSGITIEASKKYRLQICWFDTRRRISAFEVPEAIILTLFDGTNFDNELAQFTDLDSNGRYQFGLAGLWGLSNNAPSIDFVLRNNSAAQNVLSLYEWNVSWT